MDRTKVLQIVTTPMGMDGLALFPLRFAERMERVQVDFLTYWVADESVRARVEAMGGTLYVAPSRLRHPIRYLRFAAKVVREGGYRVVHAHGNSCTLAIDLLAAKLGGATARLAHSHNTHCRYGLIHRLLRPAFDRLYTHGLACGVEAGRWLFGERPFEVVPNAIDARPFAFDPDARRSVREELNLGDGRAFGCVAAFNEAKNHAFLLDVFARVHQREPSSTLVLAGDGALRESIEERARELGIADSVRMTGTRRDVPRLLQGMDAMLLPSLYEGLPTVALEWQCAGLPVLLSEEVTRDCAAARNVTFLPLDVEKWTEAALDLPRVDRESASHAGREAVARAGFDLDAAAKALEEFYLRCAEK